MTDGLPPLEILIALLAPLVVLANIAFIIVVIFFERKDPSATLAWVMALAFVPIIGFVLYLFLGQNFRRERMFRAKQEDDQRLQSIIDLQQKALRDSGASADGGISASLRHLVLLHLQNDGAVLTLNNRVTVFTDGTEKFASLLDDVRNAVDFVHLEYYIWKDDGIGNELREALTERARAGVEVRVLIDGLGGAGLPPRFFDGLREAGGHVAFFFPSFLRYLQLRYNYRNHRKIAIIDGRIGYIGGFNVGDDYLGLDPEWGYWRDAAVRFEGNAVPTAHIRFLLDWNYAAPDQALAYTERYFPVGPSGPGTPIQVVSGGPDTAFNPVKESYLKLIGTATESVYLQTPYFVPDESVLDALRIAALSGVDVRIMMPDRPDHPFVYWAGISYIRQLLDLGVKAYTYDNGFIHAKTIVVDEAVASVGSANWDVRSFRLNFETNAVMYDPAIAADLKARFVRDLEFCSPITLERLDALPWSQKFKQSIGRLFSPML